MKIINKLLNEKKYYLLKTIIIICVIIIIGITELISYFYFKSSLERIIIDSLVALILSLLLIELSFYIINKKEQQLKDQVDQLTEAYKYIGQINRKIDSILDLDIHYLDRSRDFSLEESAQNIFFKLLNLINAKAGYCCLNDPLNYCFLKSELNDPKIKKIFKDLARQKIRHFYLSPVNEHKEQFIKLGIDPNFLNKFHLISKPVYMHDKDIGQMILILDNQENIDEREKNIIRIFSFYLALNATFKPDFKVQKV